MQGGALCAWSLARAIETLDSSDVIVAERDVRRFQKLVQEHLLHWQGLRQHYMVMGVKRWRLRPKHHYLEELSRWIGYTKVNPRFTTTFDDESYLGMIKRVAVKCNITTCIQRVFERLILNLSQRWEDRRVHAGHARYGQS